MTLGDLLLCMCEVCSCGKKMSYKNLIDSARKQNRKEVLANYNKTRINIGHQQDLWMKLKEALRVQTHAEVPLRM